MDALRTRDPPTPAMNPDRSRPSEMQAEVESPNSVPDVVSTEKRAAADFISKIHKIHISQNLASSSWPSLTKHPPSKLNQILKEFKFS